MQEEEGETKPYQFPVHVSLSESNSESLLQRIEEIFLQMDPDQDKELVHFNEETTPNSLVSHLEKVLFCQFSFAARD